jgi:hypothetical protein
MNVSLSRRRWLGLTAAASAGAAIQRNLAWARAVRAAGTGVRIWEDPMHADPAQANPEMMAGCHVLCPNPVSKIAFAVRICY